MLEKTLESPLDCKKIQQVHPKGNQSWIFIRRTDDEAETPIFLPPDAKNWLTGKDSDAGRDWGQKEKGMTEDVMAGWHHWFDGRESEWTLEVGDGQEGLVCCHSWSRRVRHDWATELNWNSTNFFCHKYFPHKQFSENNSSHGLKLRPTCSFWNILCKDPWTNVNSYFLDYFLGTTAEGFFLSHASLKHLNILSSQLNWKKERISQNHKA